VRTHYLVFGRSVYDRDGKYDPWWPLFTDDGPHLAESPEAAIALVRERHALGGETDWRELAAVPANEWTLAAAGTGAATEEEDEA
jgi:hypothetical protein